MVIAPLDTKAVKSFLSHMADESRRAEIE